MAVRSATGKNQHSSFRPVFISFPLCQEGCAHTRTTADWIGEESIRGWGFGGLGAHVVFSPFPLSLPYKLLFFVVFLCLDLGGLSDDATHSVLLFDW